MALPGGTRLETAPKTGCNWNDGTAESTPSSGNSENWLLNSRFGATEYRLILFRHLRRAKPPATLASKFDYLASVPVLGRGLFLCRFTPFHLRFRYKLSVFQDGKVPGGIRGNEGKALSRVSRRAIFVPEGERGRFRVRETRIELNEHVSGLRMAFS